MENALLIRKILYYIFKRINVFDYRSFSDTVYNVFVALSSNNIFNRSLIYDGIYKALLNFVSILYQYWINLKQRFLYPRWEMMARGFISSLFGQLFILYKFSANWNSEGEFGIKHISYLGLCRRKTCERARRIRGALTFSEKCRTLINRYVFNVIAILFWWNPMYHWRKLRVKKFHLRRNILSIICFPFSKFPRTLVKFSYHKTQGRGTYSVLIFLFSLHSEYFVPVFSASLQRVFLNSFVLRYFIRTYLDRFLRILECYTSLCCNIVIPYG